ncbi:MAG: hypothetical protein NVSMB52_03590 [Chloroflexota bacterium]
MKALVPTVGFAMVLTSALVQVIKRLLASRLKDKPAQVMDVQIIALACGILVTIGIFLMFTTSAVTIRSVATAGILGVAVSMASQGNYDFLSSIKTLVTETPAKTKTGAGPSQPDPIPPPDLSK